MKLSLALEYERLREDPVGHAKDSGYSFSADNFSKLDAASLTSDFPATAQYDAAVAALGLPWRVPTEAQLQELIGNTTSEIVYVNGMKCFKKHQILTGNIYCFHVTADMVMLL